MYEFLALAIFFSTLSWPWYDVLSLGGFTLRPPVVGAIPLVAIFIIRCRYKFRPVNLRLVALLALIYFIWFIPVIYHQNPHWSVGKLVSLGVYFLIAYIAARVYLAATLNEYWRFFWPAIMVLSLVSSAISYYLAFGTLLPNTQIQSSSSFIHSTLYSSELFSDPEAAKGIRHTMAMVPVFIMALALHNRGDYPRINLLAAIFALYLVLFSFSRSAWLAAFLIALLFVRQIFKNLSRNFIAVVAALLVVSVALPVLALVFPDQFSWVWNILGDRLADEKSTQGRLWMVGQILTDSTLAEFLLGYDRVSQGSPHNTIFDALLQSGILGAIGASIITVYAFSTYFKGLFKGEYWLLTAAAFVAPALVRLFTAGSGMLHLADLTGLCLALNLGWYLKMKSHLSPDGPHLSPTNLTVDRGPGGVLSISRKKLVIRTAKGVGGDEV